MCPWQAYPTAKAPIVLVGIYNEFIVLPYISIYSYIIWYKELNPTDFHFMFSACRFYPNSSIKCDDGKVDASFKPCSYKGEIIANSSMAGMNKWCVHFVLLLFFLLIGIQHSISIRLFTTLSHSLKPVEFDSLGAYSISFAALFLFFLHNCFLSVLSCVIENIDSIIIIIWIYFLIQLKQALAIILIWA